MPFRRARRAAVALIAALFVGSPSLARAQDLVCDKGDTEVRRLSFEGNKAFSDAVLANGIITTPSSWVRRVFRVIGTRRCLDQIELRRDSLRLVVFYRNHGYSQVRVGLGVDTIAPRVVNITFRIAEGVPLVVQQFTITGLDSVAGRERLEANLPIRVGGPFDKYAVEIARDTLTRRLRDEGFPLAEVLRGFKTDTVARTATVEFDVSPGPRARIGAVKVDIEPREGAGSGATPQLSPGTILRVASLDVGAIYRERDLEAAKRNLYLTEAFRHVEVAFDSASIGKPGDSLVDVHVSVVEGYMHATRVQAGWGTLDCFRTQGEYTDLDFLHALRRLELSGRLSKIGVGHPLDIAPGLCQGSVKQDPYSDTLNYYVGATLRQGTFFGRHISPTLTLYSERRSEYLAFLRTTPVGAAASVSVQTRPRLPMSFAYQLEYGRTEAQPAIFCAVFNICEAADRDALLQLKRLAVASWSVTRDHSNSALNPSAGSILRFDVRHASPFVGSDVDLQFNKAIGDASWYWGIGSGNILVARLRLGAVLSLRAPVAGATQFVPPQERLFAGGANSVRGFPQNELGPAVYIPNQFDTVAVRSGTGAAARVDTFFRADPTKTGQRVVPTGGNRSVVANVEARLRSPFLPGLVQWAVFTDGGQVWNQGGAVQGIGFGSIKWTPGVGVRISTPVGPIRVDIGYNPYGRPPGPAYFSTRVQGIAPLYCVSPDNPLRVIGVRPPENTPGLVAAQEPGQCPATYVPQQGHSFFSRLTPHISIGQPF